MSPVDSWGHQPSITPHGYGFAIPVAVTQTTDPDPARGTRWDGVRVEVRSLSAVDITAGIDADPDADLSHLVEALAAAQNEQAPGVQPQLDAIIDIMLGA